MNINTKGTLLTKADRINARIDEFEHYFLNLEVIKDNERIPKEQFKEFVKSIHLIVTTELNEKGVDRPWKN